MMPAINIIAVLVAAVVSFIIGFIWYSPMVFGKKWAAAIGVSEEAMKNQKMDSGMMKSMGITFILSIVTAYVLANVLAFMGATSIMDGIIGAFWAWLGFILPTTVMPVVFEKKSFTAFWIGTLHQLVSLIVMGIVIVVMA